MIQRYGSRNCTDGTEMKGVATLVRDIQDGGRVGGSLGALLCPTACSLGWTGRFTPAWGVVGGGFPVVQSGRASASPVGALEAAGGPAGQAGEANDGSEIRTKLTLADVLEL